MGGLAQLLREMGPVKASMMAGVAIFLLSAFVMLSMNLSSPNFSPLYTNLQSRDSTHIVTELESKGIPYKIENNGSQISVPANQVLQLRMILAQNGLPTSGALVGYEIFDHPDALGTSNFVQNVNLLRALEGELGRTIGAFDSIEHARVHLVLPKRELFSRQKNEPTASVILELVPGKNLSKAEIKAISHLVATAVPSLKPSNITIVDTQGKPFQLGANDDDDPGNAASTSDEFRITYEKRLTNKIIDLLDKTVGPGKVQAHVTADIDFDRIVTNSETFDPDGQVVRSVQTTEEKELSSEKEKNDNVTVGNNLPAGSPDNSGASSNNNSERTGETINYEISKKVENHIKETGTVKKLSIAVLVDGNYTLDETTQQYTYTPRSPEELQKLEALVKSAVGFDEKRGDNVEVVNMQFSRDPNTLAKEQPFDWLKEELHNILQTIVVAIVVILVILLVIRPMVGRAFELTKIEEDETEFEAALSAVSPSSATMEGGDATEAGTTYVNIEGIESRVKSSSIKQINDIIDRYPEETLAVIRNWLNKDLH